MHYAARSPTPANKEEILRYARSRQPAASNATPRSPLQYQRVRFARFQQDSTDCETCPFQFTHGFTGFGRCARGMKQ